MGSITTKIVTLAQQLLEAKPALGQMAKALPDPAVFFEVLQAIVLTEPVVFLLTLARERRPRLLTHSVEVALMCIYLGVRLWPAAAKNCLNWASAGLFHDLGELRIDARLLEAGRAPHAGRSVNKYTRTPRPRSACC